VQNIPPDHKNENTILIFIEGEENAFSCRTRLFSSILQRGRVKVLAVNFLLGYLFKGQSLEVRTSVDKNMPPGYKNNNAVLLFKKREEKLIE